MKTKAQTVSENYTNLSVALEPKYKNTTVRVETVQIGSLEHYQLVIETFSDSKHAIIEINDNQLHATIYKLGKRKPKIDSTLNVKSNNLIEYVESIIKQVNN